MDCRGNGQTQDRTRVARFFRTGSDVMHADQKFDTVVIGAGVAGLGAAALLAKRFGPPRAGARAGAFHRRPHAVVRRQGQQGGRRRHRNGRRRIPQIDRYAHCYLGKCTPSIEEIFDEGLLDGRTFEAGGHGLFWGNRGRVDCLMEHLGVHHNLPLNKGLAFVKWEGEGKPTKQYQVQKGQPYPWMSAEASPRPWRS